MSRRVVFSVMVGAASLLLAAVLVGKRYAAVDARCEAAMREYERAVANARQIMALRVKQQRIARRQKPPKDVIAQVNSVLAEAGLPRDRFRALTPQSDAPVVGSSGTVSGEGDLYRRQTLSLSLQSMTAGELGRFLTQWRDSQAIWTPTQIELSHRRRGRGDHEQNSYDVTVVLSALYVAS